MIKTKITVIGNSLGVVLPKEALSKLRVKRGDVLYLYEYQDGYTISPYNKKFVEQMQLAIQIMHEDRNVLKVLAKS